MFILKKENIERIALTEQEKDRLLSYGYKLLSAPSEEKPKKKKKKAEDAN